MPVIEGRREETVKECLSDLYAGIMNSDQKALSNALDLDTKLGKRASLSVVDSSTKPNSDSPE